MTTNNKVTLYATGYGVQFSIANFEQKQDPLSSNKHSQKEFNFVMLDNIQKLSFSLTKAPYLMNGEGATQYYSTKQQQTTHEKTKEFIKDAIQKLGNENGDYPFIQSISLQFDSSLYIGDTGNIFNASIQKIKTVLSTNEEVDSIMLYPSEPEQLNLLLFSKSVSALAQISSTLSLLRFKDILEKENTTDVLASKWLHQKGLDKNTAQLVTRNSPIFISNKVRYGVNYDWLIKRQKLAYSPNPDDEAEFAIHWKILDCEFSEGINQIKSYIRDANELLHDNFIYLAQEDDLHIYGHSQIQLPITWTSIEQMLALLKVSEQNTHKKHTSLAHIVALELKVGMMNKQHASSKLLQGDLQIDKHAGKQLLFHSKELNEIRGKLYQIGLSKLLIDNILFIFQQFNLVIQSPLDYSRFIDLRSSLDYLQSFIMNIIPDVDTELSKQSISNILHQFSKQIQLSYRNRISNHHNKNNIGRKLPMITSYHGYYKEIVSTLCEGHTSLVFADRYPGITSNRYGVQINREHLSAPELFFAVAMHEACNHLTEYDEDVSNEMLDLEDGSKMTASDMMSKLWSDALSKRSPDILRYFLQDAITFLLSYHWDYKLFLYWHWGLFFNEPMNWKKNGEIHEGLFQRFMIRMILVLKVFMYLDPHLQNKQFRLEKDRFISESAFRVYFKKHFSLFINGKAHQTSFKYMNSCFDSVWKIQEGNESYEIPFQTWTGFSIRQFLEIWRKDFDKCIAHEGKSKVKNYLIAVFKDVFDFSFEEISHTEEKRNSYQIFIQKAKEKVKESKENKSRHNAYYEYLEEALFNPIDSIIQNEDLEDSELDLLVLFCLCKKYFSGILDYHLIDMDESSKSHISNSWVYKMLQQSDVPNLDKFMDGYKTPFGYAMEISTAYLKFIQKQCGGRELKNGININIVPRTKEGKIDETKFVLMQSNVEDLGAYAFDPLGGSMIYGTDVQYHYTQAKIKLERLLWIFTEMRKIHQFDWSETKH